MKFIKEHKITSIVILVFVGVIVLLFMAWTIFFSKGGNPVYGNRLEGIEKVKVTDSEEDKISSELKKDKSVKDVDTNIIYKNMQSIQELYYL